MDSPLVPLFKKEMDFQVAFAKAGGLLLGGPDPTGNGGALPGFADQREVQLLVEAGFTPPEAIEIMTLNGASYLGQQGQIGTVAAGKQADLVLIKAILRTRSKKSKTWKLCLNTASATARKNDRERARPSRIR